MARRTCWCETGCWSASCLCALHVAVWMAFHPDLTLPNSGECLHFTAIIFVQKAPMACFLRIFIISKCSGSVCELSPHPFVRLCILSLASPRVLAGRAFVNFFLDAKEHLPGTYLAAWSLTCSLLCHTRRLARACW